MGTDASTGRTCLRSEIDANADSQNDRGKQTTFLPSGADGVSWLTSVHSSLVFGINIRSESLRPSHLWTLWSVRPSG
jgi:hypothetical protein